MNYIGDASFDALASWEKQHMARGGQVFLDWAEVEFLGQGPKDRNHKGSLRATGDNEARPRVAPSEAE